MLAKIAAAIEPERSAPQVRKRLKEVGLSAPLNFAELISQSVDSLLERITPAAVFVPTRSGATARSIARYRPPVWIIGVSSQEATCQGLQFSYGVHPWHEPDHPEDWQTYVRRCLNVLEITGDFAVLTEGPSSMHPEANNRMELIDLR